MLHDKAWDYNINKYDDWIEQWMQPALQGQTVETVHLQKNDKTIINQTVLTRYSIVC